MMTHRNSCRPNSGVRSFLKPNYDHHGLALHRLQIPDDLGTHLSLCDGQPEEQIAADPMVAGSFSCQPVKEADESREQMSDDE